MPEGISQKVERTPGEQFQERLNSILYTPLSVENISQFSDDALSELIELSASVVHKYQQEYPESDALSGAALEDAAYAAYGLENLGTVLDRITAVRDRIAGLAVRIQASLAETNSVIVPPDQTGPAFGDIGSGTYEAPDKLNRLITLAYILETDFDIDQDSVRYRQGTTTDTMVRQEPYVRVEIDDLNRVVYVCDEEGNASYVFDTEVLQHLGIDTLELDQMTKNQRNAFLRVTPQAGRRIVQSPAWRSLVSQALREPFTSDGKVPVPTETTPRSEFAEQGKFLEFGDFVKEVRAAYEEGGRPGGVAKWYQKEYQNHLGWPAAPERVYKDKDWQSYPELVGQEKVKFLEFAEFISEAQAAYDKMGRPSDISTWYKNECKKHPSWPSSPDKSYRDKGWQSYPELVGREKVKFLEFSDFVTKVRVAYEKAGSPGSIPDWYKNEYRDHYGWPANADKFYRDQGWQSYPELVGREKIEHLGFHEFKTQVRAAYNVAGRPTGVFAWYRMECRKNQDWPTKPESRYKEEGWQSYPQLVGREKVEHLNFTDFVGEVRAVYEEAGRPGDVSEWYKKEYQNHSSWPSSPDKKYKDKGWVGYTALVGKV